MKRIILLLGAMLILGTNANAQHKNINEMKEFKKISPREIEPNIVKLVADDWMLITAGTQKKFNTMTASWGAMGNLWSKPVVFCFVRPQRYTFEFMESNGEYTLCFFDEKYREALNICGTLSGRDTDKIKKAGLTPIVLESGTMAFAEASMIIECTKIYANFFDKEDFIDAKISETIYKTGDFHKMYIGEIINVWKK